MTSYSVVWYNDTDISEQPAATTTTFRLPSMLKVQISLLFEKFVTFTCLYHFLPFFCIHLFV